jgi:hypothetical protein
MYVCIFWGLKSYSSALLRPQGQEGERGEVSSLRESDQRGGALKWKFNLNWCVGLSWLLGCGCDGVDSEGQACGVDEEL